MTQYCEVSETGLETPIAPFTFKAEKEHFCHNTVTPVKRIPGIYTQGAHYNFLLLLKWNKIFKSDRYGLLNKPESYLMYR